MFDFDFDIEYLFSYISILMGAFKNGLDLVLAIFEKGCLVNLDVWISLLPLYSCDCAFGPPLFFLSI